MNDFCAMKGIRREFSVARTPQQNGVAERRNRTLIEAARTMLVDSKLPITFWAKAINTACYVQNRALVVKPYNKTPYKLFRGRTPTLSFMRPFGCHVIFLNTLDHLDKFDGKANEGYFVRYSMNSKAFRVHNIITRRVEESLHIEFLENKPIVAGAGPKWLLDIHMLTKSMNYVLVIAGINSDDFSGTKDSIGADDPKMPGLETIATYDDFEEEADFTNLESSIHVSHTLTTRTHKNHPLNSVYEEKTHKDLNTCLFACFLSQIEPTRLAKALSDPAWDKKAIGTKWVFKNKKDERGIVIKNKVRLVAHGHTQEEGIDYDEVFAPIARIEAIRLFLAYASFMGFMVYQMDVKGAFLYGRIKEEVYVCQPPGFEDSNHPDKVYIVVKALYGLH
nr:retrovirus-related Pol polyprotein from transposon TNT 1-94 [Tanacetum cinerariifolium]